MSLKKLVWVGLGNYSHLNTRHNVGFNFLDYVADTYQGDWKLDSKVPGWVASFQLSVPPPSCPKTKKKSKVITMMNEVGDSQAVTEAPPFNSEYQVYLLKPKLFMNENGKAIKNLMKRLNISPNKLITAYDDLDRDLGKFGIKVGGSAGGHNGIKSTISQIQSQKFDRLRIGISRPLEKDPSIVGRYVLSKFPTDELDYLNNQVFPSALKLLIDHLSNNPPN